ncbi:hypothetical protein VNO77_41029 [Canavalia gladiata]|uniref:C2H2-type domain-containing protein n=1 Tax=Canavalia gladiata TaxID=3824 RepID=A0AAN9PRE5_CANGL
MATEIGLVSMTQIQKLSQPQHPKNQPQPNPNSSSSTSSSSSSSSTWMWNPRENHQEDDDDSWEVRAFAEDTRNMMDTTWPPRSYTCTFCRREFRSAQALGGHMNVHRRDRARLHQTPPNSSNHTTPPFINIPPQELVANAGLCLLYQLPTSPNAPFHTPLATTLNANGDSPSTLLSISSSYSPNNFVMQTCSPSFNFPPAPATGINSTLSSYSSKLEVEQPATSSIDNAHLQDLDLELRLGHKPTPS